MSFSKQKLRDLAKSHGLEVSNDYLADVCELYTTSRDEIVKVESEKIEAAKKTEIEALQDKVKKLEESAPSDGEHQKTIEDLQAKVSEYEAKEKAAEQKTALFEVLKKAKIAEKYHEKIAKITDFSKLDLKDEKLVEAMAAEYPEFAQIETTDNHTPATPPTKSTETKYGRSQIAKMTTEEINKAWADGKIDTAKE